jgi:hypothetical protein
MKYWIFVSEQIILSRFKPLWKQASFFEAAGAVKLARVKNQTTIVKFSLLNQ